MSQFDHPFSYGDKVKFSLFDAHRLDFIRGRWQYTGLKPVEYTGVVTEVKRYQLVVRVKGKGDCRIHPDLCSFVNIAANVLK